MDLFRDFPPVSAAQWKEQIEKDLRGTGFDQLKTATANGYSIQPFYTAEDVTHAAQPLFSRNGWDICASIAVSDEASANERALRVLNNGASGLIFNVYKKTDLTQLLKNISAEHIYSQFDLSNDTLYALDELKDLYGKENVHEQKLKCFVNIDPLHLLAKFGEWHDDEEKDLSSLKRLVHIPVNAALYHEAGANTVNELALALLHANEYLNYLDGQGNGNKKSFHFSFAVNSDFFTEIAKLRAFRKLMSLVQQPYHLHLPVHIHCQTTLRDKSFLDSYTNMLRTTTEGMSAILGGCNSLSILPFLEGFEKATPFADRMAINQQHILKDESYLDKVSDISAGSYFVETITEQLAMNAWEKFKELEAEGGFIKCLEKGVIQDLLERDAGVLAENLKEGKITLVGVNKYQNNKEEPKPLVKKETAGSGSPFRSLKPFRLAEAFEERAMKKGTLNAK